MIKNVTLIIIINLKILFIFRFTILDTFDLFRTCPLCILTNSVYFKDLWILVEGGLFGCVVRTIRYTMCSGSYMRL